MEQSPINVEERIASANAKDILSNISIPIQVTSLEEFGGKPNSSVYIISDNVSIHMLMQMAKS